MWRRVRGVLKMKTIKEIITEMDNIWDVFSTDSECDVLKCDDCPITKECSKLSAIMNECLEAVNRTKICPTCKQKID